MKNAAYRIWLVVVLLFYPGVPALAGEVPKAGEEGPVTESEQPADEPAPDNAPDPDRYEPLALPIIGGSTDIGVLFGATAAISKLAPGYDPYRWKGNFTAAMSVKDGDDSLDYPVNYFAVAFDIPGLWGHRLRLYPRLEFKKIINAGYYGLGNDSEHGGGTGINSFRRNQYRISVPKARLDARFNVGRDWWVLVGGGYSYVMPGPYEGSKLEEEAAELDEDGDPLVLGTDDHSLSELVLGLVLDTRDHEANPTCGMYHRLLTWYSPGVALGSRYHFGSTTLDTRFFIPIAGEYLVAAFRIMGDLFYGEVPFHELDQGMIRGVPARRYHGKIKVLGSAELRSTFYRFQVFKERFGFGVVAFFDTGRVWADYRSQPDLDGDGLGLRYGVGGGFRAMWGETRVVRTDIAYSPVKAEISPDQPVAFYIRMNHFF